MLETTKKLNEEINELKKILMRQISFDGLKNMSVEEFEMSQKVVSIVDTLQEIIVNQAEVITAIDNKLDILLARQ